MTIINSVQQSFIAITMTEWVCQKQTKPKNVSVYILLTVVTACKIKYIEYASLISNNSQSTRTKLYGLYLCYQMSAAKCTYLSWTTKSFSKGSGFGNYFSLLWDSLGEKKTQGRYIGVRWTETLLNEAKDFGIRTSILW